MPKKKEFVNTPDREGEKTYKASLKVGDKQIASIAIRAVDDEDAKEQLDLARPDWSEGVGEWELTKTETTKVS